MINYIIIIIILSFYHLTLTGAFKK